jgi:hypothetical protein
MSLTINLFELVQDGPSPLYIAKTVHGVDHEISNYLVSLKAVEFEGPLEVEEEEEEDNDEELH